MLAVTTLGVPLVADKSIGETAPSSEVLHIIKVVKAK
jgi:hypothetical protein